MVQLALWLAGCADPVPSPASPGPPAPGATPVTTGETGTDTADTASTEGTADTAALLPPLYAGDCDVDLTGASPIAVRTLLDQPSGYYFTLPHVEPTAQVFTDAAALTDWALALGLPLDPAAVDFGSEIVVAGAYYEGNTCALYLSTPLAWDVRGVPHVQIQVEDTSYGCIWECAHAQTALQVLAVPRGPAGTATVCVGVGGGCSVPAF
jgi:hypothetical protein